MLNTNGKDLIIIITILKLYQVLKSERIVLQLVVDVVSL